MPPKIERKETSTTCSLCKERKLVAILVGDLGGRAHRWYKCPLCDESGAPLRLATRGQDDA